MLDIAVLRRSYIMDVVVLAAMLSVAAAVAIALILEAGITPVVAVALAAIGYLPAAIGHVLLRKTQKLERLQTELGTARKAETTTPAEHAGQPPRQSSATTYAPEPATPELSRAGLARLNIVPPKAPPSKQPLQAHRKTDIESIIRRLENDIKSGRKVQEGVCLARPDVRPEISPATRQSDVADNNAANLSTCDSADLQPQRTAPLQTEAGLKRASQKVDAADKLAAVADALVREKLDVFLEPIRGLDDGQEHHFEVSIRLHLADGDIVDHKHYAEIARGAAWLPLIDVVKVSQAKKVALNLSQHGQNGTFISQINGQSVSAGKAFSDDLASIMGHEGLMAGRLVLSITQDDVRRFAAAQWATVHRLRQLGFRFAIAEVNSLDLDFEMLAERGFQFAKLDALVFLEGLPAAQTLIPPTDVCRYLAGAGLTLIVDGIVDEVQKAKVLGFGALYGQGLLFGAPRPVTTQTITKQAIADTVAHQVS